MVNMETMVNMDTMVKNMENMATMDTPKVTNIMLPLTMLTTMPLPTHWLPTSEA